MTKLLAAMFVCFSVLVNFASAQSQNFNVRQSVMMETLIHIRDLYLQHYAQLGWKEEQRPNLFLGKYQEIAQAIQNEPNMTKNRFRDLLHDFVASTRDYHVDITFYSTESSVLPFSVRSAENRVFVAHIKPTKDPAYQGMSVGDEIIEWNGESPIEMLNKLRKNTAENESATDLRLAELHFTFRNKMERDQIEKGTFLAKFRRPDETEYSLALTWAYTPEMLPTETPIVESLLQKTAYFDFSKPVSISDDGILEQLNLRQALLGLNPLSIYRTDDDDDDDDDSPKEKGNQQEDPNPDPVALGQRKSIVPDLGKIVWENGKDNPFRAYVYLNSKGKLIGYMRIPSYGFCKEKRIINQLDDNIRELEDKTDALVLDQIGNPGGYLEFTYTVISRLVSEPAFVMPHRMAISEEDGFTAFKTLLKYSKIPVEKMGDAQSEKCGYHYGASAIYADRDYSKFILDQLKEGKTLTDPVSVKGIWRINPEGANYDKPVLMLIDAYDFSGADFTPAMLQDSGRVKTFGTRTSGAGGIVQEFSFPNQFGIKGFRITVSQAIRKNGQPLENLGVQPDIPYEITADDLQFGYRGYRKAINAAVDQLISSEAAN